MLEEVHSLALTHISFNKVINLSTSTCKMCESEPSAVLRKERKTPKRVSGARDPDRRRLPERPPFRSRPFPRKGKGCDESRSFLYTGRKNNFDSGLETLRPTFTFPFKRLTID